MDIQTFFCRLATMLLSGLCLLLIIVPATAQDEPPPPQFLYRNENRLVLINGYTGETTELPFEVTERDRFEWSPDGQYLLARLKDEETNGSCLNLYDVHTRAWASNEPISCGVWDAIFSADGTRIVYTVNGKTNGSLWLYSLADKTSQELYRTTEGDELIEAGISNVQWSPTETYLTFEILRWIMGGSVNTFVVMNAETENHFTVKGGGYYASFYPIWSEDDRWFLMSLKGEYVTSFAVPKTNHKNDVYLVNSETGDQYRLTYTPAVLELDLRWTDDGRITFTEVIEQKTILTLEQAKQVEVVPPDQIVMPEPVDIEAYYDARTSGNDIVSPDSNIGAWISYNSAQSGDGTVELNIGSLLSTTNTPYFSAPIPESYQYSNILIGWRPSDYPYPQG